MSETVLHTKLFIPPLRPSLVARPRLVERLNKAANARLILVSAPAGFGKTTLVTTWLGQQEQPAAWVSLDESDNTPQRIFIYLLAAIQTVYPDLGQKLLVALNSHQPPADDALIPALINELSVKAAPLVLVLDDYHVIRNQTIHNALSFFVDYLPPAFQLVLTSREDPPLPLPRWRARGQLLEIRAPDLRFTGAEVPAFLEETMGLQLEEAAVTELADRTEGWVAGLQLAALSIRSSEDVPAFVKSFGGSDRQIADYLLQEVLLRQPSAAQQFMLRTALLDRFNADSCDHLLEQENSQEMLDALDLSNLFLIPLDNERFWYRYHHLFAQLLRHRLLREVPAAEAARLHRRAAQWYEGQGYREEAIAHALQIPDLDYTAQMVSSMPTHALYEQGGTGLVKQWAEALPPEIIQRYPRVAILAAGAYMITGDAPNLRKVLALIAGDPSTQAEQALFQSIMVRNQDADYRQALHLATVAFKGVKAGDRNLQAVANLQIAVNQLYLGQLAEAEQTIINLRQTIDKEDPTTLSILFQAYHMQSSIAVERADYFQAQNICREGLAVAEESGSRHAWPFAALLYCRLAGIYYQWNEYEPASEYQALALDWGKRTGISDILIEAYLVQADLAAWKADREAVFKAIDGIKAIIVDSRLDEIIARMEALTALYYWRTGAVDEAVRWANASGYSLDNQPTFQQYNTYLPLAKIRFAECRLLGNKQAAAAVLALTERVLGLTSGNQYRFGRIECLTLKALILAWQDKRQEALEALAEALDLAQPGTLMRVFLDWGRPMQELLVAAAGLRSTYTGRLLEAFTAEGTAVSPGPSRSHSSEPAAATALHLTGREKQILQLIASGLSNKEIEEILFISKNTVRTHIKNLYSKLEVESRTQAVQRAGQLGLL